MKSILFDLDGTLIDSSLGITKCAQYALRQFGIEEPDLKKLQFFIGPPLMYTFQNHYGFTQEQAKKAIEIYRGRYNPIGAFECELYPGVKNAIIKLKETGYRIGMASSKPEDTCIHILKHFEIYELFDDVVGATFDGKIGTKEEVLQEVFRRWSDSSREDMILIGDTMFDVEGAKQTGIDCVVVSFGFGNVAEMVDAGAVAVCDHMETLPNILEQYFANRE